MSAAHPPADELAVDVQREGVVAPGRGHLVPLARVPFRDRDVDASDLAGVRGFGVGGFEAQEMDALREPYPVSELDESGVVLVAALPAGLHPEGDAAARMLRLPVDRDRDPLGGGKLDVITAVEGDVVGRGGIGGRGRGLPRGRCRRRRHGRRVSRKALAHRAAAVTLLGGAPVASRPAVFSPQPAPAAALESRPVGRGLATVRLVDCGHAGGGPRQRKHGPRRLPAGPRGIVGHGGSHDLAAGRECVRAHGGG